MEIYIKISLFPCFKLFSGFQTLMTSQIRSHIEYLMHTYYILMLIL